MTTITMTYDREYQAHMIGHPTLDEYPYDIVTIPDEVAEDQEEWDGKTFVAYDRYGGELIVRLAGDEYDLHGSGTGDTVVEYVE